MPELERKSYEDRALKSMSQKRFTGTEKLRKEHGNE